MMEFPFMKEHWKNNAYMQTEKFRRFVDTEVMALRPEENTTIRRVNESE